MRNNDHDSKTRINSDRLKNCKKPVGYMRGSTENVLELHWK